MRSLILSLLFVVSSIFAIGQASETCSAAEGAAMALTSFPNTETITVDPAWTNDTEYIPTNPSGALSVAYWSFQISASGFYNIDFQTTGAATINTDVSIGISDGTISACPMNASTTEIYSGMLMIGMTSSGGCTFLSAGTYTMAFAVNQGNEGEIEVIINNGIEPTNITCATASTMNGAPTPGATNEGNNSCSSGLVWYEYTVVQGGSVTLTASTSGTGTDIPAADLILTQYSIDNCASFTPVVGNTVTIPCLPVGAVLSFEVGDDTAPIEQGTFTITIVDDMSLITNETCDNAVATLVPTCMTTELTTSTTNTTVDACPDPFAGCPTFETESTVWFAFTTDGTAQTVDIEITNGSISGTEFALIDASAGCPSMIAPATAIGGCQTGGSLLAQAIDINTTYYIAVSTAAGGTDGTFTLNVTPQNPPSNNTCTDAIDISATAAAGIDGTTACATAGVFDFCPAISEDHVVYYTYTVDASITTNRTVTITTTASTIPTGTAATSLGYGIFSDCAGTPATMPSGANLLPLVGAPGDLCDPLAGTITYECVEPGTSFTIAVASADMMEGDFNIMITEMATGTADNDDCNLGSNPDITDVTMGTNFCADGEFDFCEMPTSADHQVWYQYTNDNNSNVDLIVTFSGTATPSSATDLSMLVLSGACGTNTVFPGTPTDGYCNILGTPTTISCIEVGETIRILVGSEEDPTMQGPEGDFNITTDEISNSPANDECTGAVDITPPTCTWIAISSLPGVPATAENACPEDFNTVPAGCGFTTEATVWYSITVPNDLLTYTLDIQNISDDAFLSIFESTGADCDSYGTPSIGADCETGAGPHGGTYGNLTNGATYFIAVGDPTEASGFDFEIRLNLLPENDECADAIELTGNTPTDGTTACATQEMSAYDGACADVDETNTVWYEYTVPSGDKGFNITIAAGTTAFTAPIITSVFETDACDISAATLVGMDNCSASAAIDQQFECVGPGTYTIMVSTSSMNEGDFQITITPVEIVQANDNCDAADAITLNPGLECTWMPTTATTTDACPEVMSLDPSNCGIDEFPVVWYSVTAPANATFLDLQITGAGAGVPFMAVYDDGADCNLLSFVNGSTCYSGVFEDLNALGENQITVTGGTTYLIAVGTDDLDGSTIDFEIKWITPPVNDECADAIDLVAATATDGTTSCATQEMNPYNGMCDDVDETNTVWYTYTVPNGDKGFHITIAGGATEPFMNPITTAVFETDACDISANTLVGMENCAASGLDEQFECVGPGTYTILISTSAANEGNFTITITPITQVVANDLCDNPELLPAQEQCEWTAFTAVTTDACPEDFDYGSDCGFNDYPVVWYSVTSPADADFLDVALNFGGTMPFFAIFPSTIECENVTSGNALNANCIVGPIDELGAGNEIPVTENTTYLIAVGANVDAGVAALEFELKWITPPDNDDCANAEVFNALTASGNPGEFSQTLVMETTQCATLGLTGTACDPDKTNTVWYTYTVGMDVKEITIDITNYMNTNTDPTAMPEFSLAVFDGCTSLGFLTQADGSAADYCGGEGVDLLTFSCLDEGDVLTILVSSSALNEGTFDITINTAEPNCTYTNDECDNASPLTGNPDPLITDDPNDCVLVSGCNDLACTEFDFSGACPGIDVLNSVFYTFTTDDLLDVNGNPVDAFVNIEVLNGEAGELDSPGAILFSGGCGAAAVIGACAGTGGLGTFNSGPLGMPGQILPNTTYTVVVYNGDTNQNGGTFDLCVTVSSGCVNDEVCDAFTLDPGVTVDNPASSTGCTDDVDVSGCGAAQNEATLWYQVEVPEGASSIEITLFNQPTGGVTGDVSIAVGPLVDCNNLDLNDVLYTDCAGFTTNGGVHEIECAVEFGTYWIQIGSEDEMEAGDFTITYTFNTDLEPSNDLCSTAENLDVTDICEFVSFPGTLKGACPELFDLGACQFSMNGGVWYTITIPAGPPTVLDMDIEIEQLANPMIGVFEFDCMNAGDPANNNGIVGSVMNADGTVDCSDMALTEGIGVTPGTTYHILVSSSTMEDTDFNINIRLNAPPINDDPCITSINPPLDLTGGGSHAGTTCCARGPKDSNPDGSQADWQNQNPCNDSTEDAAVWYMFTADPLDAGYQVIVNGGSISNQMTVQIYGTANPGDLCNAVPTGDGVIASSCSSLSVDIRFPNCEDGFTYFVKVTSDDDDCGDFDITIQKADVCDYADECEDVTEMLETSTQESCADPLEYITVPGCLDLACPEDAFNNCMQDMGPTVWFQIIIDDPEATALITQVDAPGFDPVWAIFEGTSCADMTPVASQEVIDGVTQTFPCSNSDGDALNIYSTPIPPDAIANGLMYWVSVTGLGEIEDPNFDFSYNSALPCLSCSGDSPVDCNNGEFTASVMENGTWVEVPDDFQFCQGIDVQVCLDFNYDTTGSGNDWLHGFVPVFGPGWDVSDDILAGISPGGSFEFFGATGDCAPILNGYDLPNVCTYVEDGVLKLCNSACDASCPCSGGMESGDALPSGYWWNTGGGNPTCGTFGCSPASFFGWPSATNVDVTVCFELMTKEFDSFEECEEKKSLQIIVQTFSDAISGCWDDANPCVVDPSFQGPAWQMECNVPPPVEGLDAELCNEGTLDLFVQTSDGSPTEIQVDVIDNPNVSGENSFTFNGGTGTIDDQLTNNSTVTQVVEYVVYSVDPSLLCPGTLDTIEVTIYPELMVTFDPVFVCEGDCTDITPDIIGGAGMPYEYEWSNGDITASTNVCPVVPTTYFVTVTDVLGCQGIGEVEVDVKPPVELLLPESIDVCKDDSFDPFSPDYIVCLDFISGSSPYSVSWVTEQGLVGQAGGFQGECFIINEVASSAILGSPMGVYTLEAVVTDFFGCMGTVDMEVVITGELTLLPMVSDVECGDTEADITITGFDSAGGAVTSFLLYGGCPDNGLGTFLDDAFAPTGTWTFPTVDLNDFTCYTIVASTESGCQSTIEIDIPVTTGTPIDIGGDDAVCIGSDATITIANAGDYTGFVWTPNIGNTGSVTITPDSTASYIVEATDASGCVSSAIWTVTVNPEPTIALAGALQFCENGSATITASGGGIGGTYEWTGVAGAQSGASYTTNLPGDAEVTVTDANGCVSDSTITFSSVLVIEILLADANICDGMGDTLFVPSNIINVSWQDGTPTEVSDTSFYVITTPGVFTVTGQDAATGCDAAGSFTVEEFITPIINIPDTVEVCRLDSGVDSLCIDLTAIASGSDGGTWSQDGIIPDFTFSDFPLNDVCFEDIVTGCYPFTYTTNTASSPCVDTMATMMVCVKACPCPVPAIDDIPVLCNIGTYNLMLAEQTTDPGTWSVESAPGGQDIAGLLNGTIFTATGIIPGDYVVRFTLDNPGGGTCELFREKTITVVGQDIINVIDQGQLCNIDGQQFPTGLDLYDLIDVDATNGGTWVQTGPETMIPITGGSMISSAGITDFTETFTFEYTSGSTGGPCPPTMTEVTVNIFDCTCPILIVAMDTLCNDGLAIDLDNLLTNDDNLSGTWSTNGNLVGANMFDPNGLPSGAYDITYTLDSSPGADCPTEFSNVIIVRRQAVVELADGDEPCAVDTGNGPTSINLYSWLESGYTLGSWTQTGGDVLTFSDDGNSIANVEFLGQDVGEEFMFEFTTQGALDPCTNTTVSITIVVQDCNCPPIELVSPDPVCNDGGTFDICLLADGSDPGTFAVLDTNGDDITSAVTGCTFNADGLDDGTYTIVYELDETVTGICTQSLSVPFEIIEYVGAELLDAPQVCNDVDGNGTLAINFFDYVTNSSEGVWTDTDGAGVDLSTNLALTNVNFAIGNNGGPVPAGSYTFTFTIDNAEPCDDVVLEMEIVVVDDCNCAPIILGNPADVCSTDGPVDLTQYDDPAMPGTWSSNELTVENGNSLITDGVAAGAYTLTYTINTVIPDCPETAEVMILIGEPANPGTPAEDLRICEGDAQVITLDDRLIGADFGGVWTETSTSMSTGFSGNTFNSDGQSAGMYTFQYSLTDNAPCPDADVTVTIIIDSNPISDAGTADVLDCVNTSEDLGVGTGTSTGADFVYSWTLDGDEVGTEATLTGVTVEGTYQLLVTNSVTGCSDVSTVTVVKSDDLPTFTIATTDITCNGDNDGALIISDQNGGDGNYSYSLNGGSFVDDAGSFTGLLGGDYTIAIMDGIGCTTEQTFTIVEPDPVSVNIAGEDIIVGDVGAEFTLTIDPAESNIDSVVWSDFNDPTIIFCSGTLEDCTSITLSPEMNTTVAYVEVFDANGCSANDQVQIQLDQIVDVIFPNIITPNGDGNNDFFFVASDDVEQVLSMRIFDRWGELIWEETNIEPRVPSEGWDGKFNESPVVPGVYVFTVEVLFNDLDNTRETFSGDITVTDGE